MAETSAWMPLYIGDYLADTMHLTGAQHGAYLLLIMHYWRSGKPLPDDDKALAAITRFDRKEWITEIGPEVRQFFRSEDGRLHHKRIDAELAKAMQNSSKRREAANARWMQNRSTSNASAYPNASDVHSKRNDPRARSLSLSQSQSPEEGRGGTDLKPPGVASLAPKREAHGQRLPDDWNPGDVGHQFARNLGLAPAAVFQQFRDYWHAQPGAKGRKADWPATWRNWCRREAERRPSSASLPLDAPRMTGGL